MPLDSSIQKAGGAKATAFRTSDATPTRNMQDGDSLSAKSQSEQSVGMEMSKGTSKKLLDLPNELLLEVSRHVLGGCVLRIRVDYLSQRNNYPVHLLLEINPDARGYAAEDEDCEDPNLLTTTHRSIIRVNQLHASLHPRSYRVLHGRPTFSLLRSCRRLFNLARFIFYECNLFSFRSMADMETTLIELSEEQAQAIKDITVHLRGGGWYLCDHFPYPQLQRNLQGLQHLTFSLTFGRDWYDDALEILEYTTGPVAGLMGIWTKLEKLKTVTMIVQEGAELVEDVFPTFKAEMERKLLEGKRQKSYQTTREAERRVVEQAGN